MSFLHFSSSFSQPTNHQSRASFSGGRFSTAAFLVTLSAGVAAFSGVAVLSINARKPKSLPNHSSPFWASLSLADDNSSPVVESKSGISFPLFLSESRRLLGIGFRRKSLFGLKNIDVYAYGVYADEIDVKNRLGVKYEKLSIIENKDLNADFMESDIGMTIRLQIVYGRLKIGSVRSAFEESVGSRLQKFGGSDNKELLQRFTSLFKDEYKLPKGSVIELSREQGHVLCTTIDGNEVGKIESKLLCQSILDLYIGEDPFDKQAKADIEKKLASLLHN